MTNRKKKMEEKLDQNCGKCAWSNRDTKELAIKCCLGRTINNTWVTAHNCRDYTDITKINNKKRVPNTQLDLFIHQNL